MSAPAGVLDAGAWVRRWERQQANYVADREASFALMLEVVDRLGAAPGRLVDLGCGPGSIAARARERWPSAEIVGVDLDPVLLELGRRTLGDRVRWLDADLRQPGWSRQLDGAPVDSVVSATALHWLDPEHLREVARELAGLVRPDGVVVTYDTMPLGASTPHLRALSHDLHLALVEEATAAGGDERWEDWWAALAAEPELAAQFTDRAHRFQVPRHGPGPCLDEYIEAFCDAGFREVATLKQVADRRMVVAFR
ncbi:class I SAM-dependent methyltransferase [Pseudonocardia sichuanensis]